MADCAWFMIENATPEFKGGREVRRFKTDYVGDRATTVRLLRHP
jgi:hypothetical protein